MAPPRPAPPPPPPPPPDRPLVPMPPALPEPAPHRRDRCGHMLQPPRRHRHRRSLLPRRCRRYHQRHHRHRRHRTLRDRQRRSLFRRTPPFAPPAPPALPEAPAAAKTTAASTVITASPDTSSCPTLSLVVAKGDAIGRERAAIVVHGTTGAGCPTAIRAMATTGRQQTPAPIRREALNPQASTRRYSSRRRVARRRRHRSSAPARAEPLIVMLAPPLIPYAVGP